MIGPSPCLSKAASVTLGSRWCRDRTASSKTSCEHNPEKLSRWYLAPRYQTNPLKARSLIARRTALLRKTCCRVVLKVWDVCCRLSSSEGEGIMKCCCEAGIGRTSPAKYPKRVRNFRVPDSWPHYPTLGMDLHPRVSRPLSGQSAAETSAPQQLPIGA